MRIPKKNIFKKMMDIRAPKVIRAEESLERKDAKRLAVEEITPPERTPAKEREFDRGGIPWKAIFLSILIFIVLGGACVAVYAYQSKRALLSRAEKGLEDSGLSSKLNLPGGSLEIKSFEDVRTKLFPLLSGGFGAYKGVMGGISAWIKFGQDTALLKTNISGFLSGGEGDILTPLKGISGDIAALSSAIESVDATGDELKSMMNISPEDYLNLKLELKFWEKTSASLANWLSSDRKIIVFLQNSSEMRPTGGFWGSYAEINIRSGKLASIEVRDINEPDRTLELETVPPKPLQALVTNWRAADSNWFFNFPDSATKAAEFMDSSKLYGDAGERVDMIAAVSPAVVADLLQITGPINVSSTKVAIDENNFLEEIQAEVQKKQDVGSKTAKNIVDEVFAGLLPKLSSLDADSEQKILSVLFARAKSKDIMFWAGDEELEAAFKDRGLDGSVFEIPQKFEGDYLSVVSSNVGGGKSDYVMSQKIVLESQLTLDGLTENHLEISRKNNAKSSDKWWYKMINQSYSRVYVSSFGKLTSAKGGILKTINSPINYKVSGYTVDPLVEEIESSAKTADNFPWLSLFSEAGKTVLATWQRTAPGETSKLSYDYSRRMFLSPADGVVYQFIMDKQPGVNSEYNLSFSAPVGFVWKENNSPVFEYRGKDIPARLMLNLTLARTE